MEWKVFLLAVGFIGLGVAGIAIKILLKKNGTFAGTCASANPMFQNDAGTCSVCGARPEDNCLAPTTSKEETSGASK